ncbi:PRD domain-containing protein, partial [Listeria monocytogenes]|nr:PRD domain-containing protein [Listeria monocytogenes]
EFTFTDYAFQSIVIHLAIAVERIREGEYVENVESDPMKDVFESQRNNTEILVGMLEERLDIKIQAFEVGYIQLHLTAAYNEEHDELLVNTPPQEDDVADFVTLCLA